MLSHNKIVVSVENYMKILTRWGSKENGGNYKKHFCKRKSIYIFVSLICQQKHAMITKNILVQGIFLIMFNALSCIMGFPD